MKTSRLLAGLALFACMALTPLALRAATVTIVNGDAAGVGFNDLTPAAPVGGNMGTTLGQQRMIAFQAAGNKWGATLASNITIRVSAVWTALTCTTNSAVLGSAGATEVFRDFSGAPVGGHWYAKALANKISGTDLDGSHVDISANFNVNLGKSGCLTGVPFYLGLDNNHAGGVDLIAVITHELGHGLGFQTFTDGQTGAQNGGLPSIWDDFLLDNTTNKTWTMMTAAERVASAVNTGHLVWNGGNVTAAIPQVLQAQGSSFTGADAQGRGLMYSPSSYQGGSSVSHFDTSMFRNQLMEPAINGDLTHEVTPPQDLTFSLLKDIGWSAGTGATPTLTIAKTHTGNFTPGQSGATFTVTVSNPGTASTSGTVTVTDTLPSGLTLVSMAGTGWNCASTSCMRSDALTAGASYPGITVTVNVAANANSPQVNAVAVSGGGSASANTTDSVVVQAGGGVATSAVFVNSDTTTQGTWKGVYGSNGQVIADDSSNIPSYAQVAFTGQTAFDWDTASTDPRALQRASSSGRIASTWYAVSGFSVDINITDGATHQIAVYCLDLYSNRPERIQMLNAATSAVLDTRDISNTANGLYLVWNVSGHVKLQAVPLAGVGLFSGIFFGPGGVAAPALTISKTHTGNFTQGQTNAAYTVTVANKAGAGSTSGTVTVTETVPAGLTLASMAGTGWTCASNTCTRNDALAAGASYPAIAITVNVGASATSPQVNSVAVSGGGSAMATATDSTAIATPTAPALSITKTHAGSFTQAQSAATFTVTVRNSGTASTSGTVTVTETLPSGLSLISMAGTGWTCASSSCTRGDILAAAASYPAITVTVNVGASATSPQVNSVAVSGGGSVGANTTDSVIVQPSAGGTAASAVFVNSDTTTQGTWKGVYGSNGEVIADDSSIIPSYAQVAFTGQTAFDWDTASTDPRALQRAGSSGRIASTWYAVSGFSVDINITDGATHQIAVYCLDLYSNRPERVQLLNAVTNAVLDTRDISNTANGLYLVWNVSGHVKLQTVPLAGVGLFSGIFFGTAGTAPAAFAISKTHAGSFTQGQTSASYSVTVGNQAGAGSTSGTVTVTEAVPSGLTLVSMAGTGWTCAATSCTRSDTLAAGASYPAIAVTVNVGASATSPQVNSVTVSGGGSTMATATDSTTIATPTAPALSITKTHQGNFTQGQSGATYTLTVRNNGTASTSGTVTVTETVPSGLALVSMAGTNWTCVAASCTRNDALAAGTSYPAITVTVNVGAAATSPQVNSVAVSGGGSGSANTTDSTIISPPATPLLAITKTHAGNFTQGQSGATFTVTVRNNGTGSTSGTVTMTETLPSGLTLISMAGTGWTCASNSCTRGDALAAAASYPAIAVTVNVGATATSPQVNAVAVSGGGSASANTTDSVIVQAGGGATTSAVFVNSDTATQGTWKGVYGSNGQVIADDSSNIPSYAQVAFTGQTAFDWDTASTDPRALQRASSSGRIASTWYAVSGFSVDINITDGATHQIAVYCLDLYSNRPERIQLLNAATSAVLDTRDISNTASGLYLVWNVSGHVKLQTVPLAGVGLFSGIFFGPGGAAAPALTISKTHTGNFTQGQTNAAYNVTVANQAGAGSTSGIVTVTETVPAGLTLASMAGTGWTCATNTCTRSDALATGASYPSIAVTVNVAANATSPQVNSIAVSGGGSALASATDSTVIVPLASPALSIAKTHTGNFTQGQSGATFTVTVRNSGSAPTSGTVSVTETLPSGLALVSMGGTGWNCAANSCTRNDALGAGASYPSITVTVNVGGAAASPQINAVAVSGGGSASANTTDSVTVQAAGGVTNSAVFVKTDTATQGTWKGVYGSNGQVIADDSSNIPSYAQVAFTGQIAFDWDTASTDARALQRASSSGRIASTWYAVSGFSVDINVTDGATHQIAVYCLDLYSNRPERIQVVDATTNAVLDSHDISNTANSLYLVWNVTGHVKLQAVPLAGVGLFSGIFFGQ